MSNYDFCVLVDRTRNGTPLGRGWGRYNVSCPKCGRASTEVKIIGSKGYLCPDCGCKRRCTWPDMLSGKTCDGGWLDPVWISAHGWEKASVITNN